MTISKKLWPIFLLLFGCASIPSHHADHESPPEARQLLEHACESGKNIQSVQGRVAMKTKSPVFSGQFSANVNVLNPDELKLEIINFIGGTEALIIVDHDHYQVTGSHGETEKKAEGYGTWGGIPLRWATNLFLGKIPCPTSDSDLDLSMDPQGKLVVQVAASGDKAAEQFIFGFGRKSKKHWPESLHWERQSTPPMAIDFKFDSPEDRTGSPKKWEAHSAQGMVKVRWRDRSVSEHSKN